jgi:hypothetical protein
MARYHELLIEGPRGWTLGFIQGFLRGRGEENETFDAEEEGIDCGDLGERVHELIHRSEEVDHLIAPESALPTIRRAVENATAFGRRIEIRSERPLAGVRFTFSTVVYSREHAKKIRRIFYQLGEGVRLSEDTAFDEIVDPGAKGIEAYAPVHDFELRGKGSVEGSVDGVVELYRVCREEPLIQEGAAQLIPAATDQKPDAE